MMKHDLDISEAAVGSVKPWNRNPRHGDVNLLEASLSEFGQREPLVIYTFDGDDTPSVIVGNHRYHAALNLGWETVIVSDVTALFDDEKATKYAVIDNRASDQSSYDPEVYADLLAELHQTDESFITDIMKMSISELEQKISGLPFEDATSEPEHIDLSGSELTNDCPKCGYKW